MRKIKRNRWFYLFELIVDIIIVMISYYLGFKWQRPDLFVDSHIPFNVLIQLIIVGAISLLLFLTFQTFRCGKKDYASTMFYVILCLFILPFVAVFIDLTFKNIGFWRRTMFYATLVELVTFPIVKFIFLKIHDLFIKPNESIIIGSDKESMLLLLKNFTHRTNTSYDVNYLVLDKSKDLYKYIDGTRQVIINNNSDTVISSEVVEYCAVNNIDCMIVPTYNDIIINGGKFISIDDTMMFKMDIKMDMEMRILKRGIDIFVSTIGIVLSSPIMLIAAILIKLQDGGKVIFAQERVTRNNKPFTMYKFRTMIEDAEEKSGAVLATADDERITKIGKFMRLFRVDELPQLFNVFLGEMSFVGPRPERREFIDEIVADTPEFRYRTLVKAGLTGLAQSMGKYDTEFTKKVLYDLYYVTNYSLILDFKIIFYTVRTIFTPSIARGVDENADIDTYFDALGYNIQEKEDCLIINKNK